MQATDWLGLSLLPGIIVSSALGALIMCLLVLRYGFAPLHESATDETPTDATHRLIVTRLGHAGAGFCFAVSAILAVVALVQQPRVLIQPTPRGTGTEAAAAIPSEIDQMRRKLTVLEGRLGRAEFQVRKVENRLETDESDQTVVATRLDGLDARVAAAEGALRQAGANASRARVGQSVGPPPGPESRRLRAAPEPGRALVAAPPVIRPGTPSTVTSRTDSTPPSTPPPVRVESSPLAAAATSTPTKTPSARDDTDPRVTRVVESRTGPAGIGGKLRDDWKIIKREAKNGGDELRNAFQRLRDFLTQ